MKIYPFFYSLVLVGITAIFGYGCSERLTGITPDINLADDLNTTGSVNSPIGAGTNVDNPIFNIDPKIVNLDLTINDSNQSNMDIEVCLAGVRFVVENADGRFTFEESIEPATPMNLSQEISQSFDQFEVVPYNYQLIQLVLKDACSNGGSLSWIAPFGDGLAERVFSTEEISLSFSGNIDVDENSPQLSALLQPSRIFENLEGLSDVDQGAVAVQIPVGGANIAN